MPETSPQTSAGTTRVVAVVVTWNRRELLAEAVAALRAQSHPLAAIVVVDNASTDGTDVALASETGLDVVRLEQNTGGAGGFAVGIEQALTHDPDLVWLLDDDTIPTPDAARELVGPWRTYAGPDGRRPAVLASKVVWTDGRDHPMNTPATQARGRAGRVRARRAGGGGADPLGQLRLDHVRRGPGARARSAAGRLLPLERRLRVLHPPDPGPGRPLLPGQRRGAQDQGLRLDRRRPGGAVLLRGPQQGLAVQPLAQPGARRRRPSTAPRRCAGGAAPSPAPRTVRRSAAPWSRGCAAG